MMDKQIELLNDIQNKLYRLLSVTNDTEHRISISNTIDTIATLKNDIIKDML